MAWSVIASADSPTSGAFDFSSLTFTGYTIVQVVMIGLTVTTDATDIGLTFYVSSSEVTSGYRWGHTTALAGGSGVDDGDISDPSILLVSNDLGRDVGNAAGEGFDCIVTLDEPLDASHYQKARAEAVATTPSGAVLTDLGIGIMETTGAIDGLKITGTSNITAGKVRILGWA